MPNLADYYTRFDPAKRFDALLFRSGRGLQSAELNETQQIMLDRLNRLGGALFKDGARIAGAGVVIAADGTVTAEAGALWVRGAVRDVAGASFTVPVLGACQIGVRVSETVVSELEEPSLRDPALGTRNYDEPGACRLRLDLIWGWSGDGAPGDFYRVFDVENGSLVNPEPPPQLDSVMQALARYDRDANGSYIVAGFEVAALGLEATTGEQIFNIAHGVANIDGFKRERTAAVRKLWPFDPDLRRIANEPHLYQPASSGGSFRLAVNRAPIHQLISIEGTKEKTATLTRGPFTGGSDALPDDSVLQIVEIKQGATTYAQNSDWKFTLGMVDWSSTGAEPAPGSTYSVKYRYITEIPPSAADDDGFTVTGLVDGSQIQVTYDWRVPRIDRVLLAADADIIRLKGIAHPSQPPTPATPVGCLPLATIVQVWRTGVAPQIINDGIRVTSMAALADIQTQINDLRLSVAAERLKSDVSSRAPTTRYGMFIDPFHDDDMRDQGTVQTAAILPANQELVMPVAITVQAVGAAGGAPWLLPWQPEVAIAQTLQTGSIKINPYASFDPIPAALTLNPAVDQYVQTDSTWTSISTGMVMGRWLGATGRYTIQYDTEVLSSSYSTTTTILPFMREIPVQVTAKGFGPGEQLADAKFAGISVTPTPHPTANGAGVLTFTFTIPARVPAGVQTLTVTGAAGSRGEVKYTASNRIETQNWTQVTRTVQNWWDPVAQSFVVDEAMMLAGLDLWFAAKGSDTNPVTVELREMENGWPTKRTIAEATLAGNALSLTGPTRVLFDAPARIEGQRDYCFVLMTDDANHAVRLAELGKFDAVNQKWVTTQGYTVGTLFSSSNNTSWTVHQEKDLTFRLLRCAFTATERLVNLGTVPAGSASDVILAAGAWTPDADTGVEFTLTDGATPTPQVLTLAAGQGVNLTTRLTGAISVQARLTGSTKHSPVLYPGVQVLLGDQAGSGTYVSRAVTLGAAASLTAVLELLLPGTATAVVEAKNAAGQWVALTQQGATALGDGWAEITFTRNPINLGSTTTTQIRVTLSGSQAARPRAKNLRVFAV